MLDYTFIEFGFVIFYCEQRKNKLLKIFDSISNVFESSDSISINKLKALSILPVSW